MNNLESVYHDIYLKVNDIIVSYDLNIYKEMLLEEITSNNNLIQLKNKKNTDSILLYIIKLCYIKSNKKITKSMCLDIIKKKNNDYGNSYKDFGYVGILIRIIDKINRLKNLSNIDKYNINETYFDTLLDLHNYCVLSFII